MRSNQTEVTLFSYLLYLIDFIEFGCQIKNKLCLKIGLVPPFWKNKLIADVYVSTYYGTSIQQVGELSDGFCNRFRANFVIFRLCVLAKRAYLFNMPDIS